MELIEVDTINGPLYKPSTSARNGSSSGLNDCKDWVKSSKIFLFKHSPWICLVEGTVIIAVLVYLSVSSTPSVQLDTSTKLPIDSSGEAHKFDPAQSSVPSGPSGDALSDLALKEQGLLRFNNYTDGHKVVTLAPGLALQCTQRGHDLQFATRCFSGDDCPRLKYDKPSIIAPNNSASGEPLWMISSYRTSKSGDRLKAVRVPIRPSDLTQCLNDNTWNDECRFKTLLDIPIDDGKQKIIGWGGALTDSSIGNILSLTINGTLRLLDDYFGYDGLRYNMIRVTIGGSDFSARFYTNSDPAPDLPPIANDDTTSRKFTLNAEDRLYKIPMLRQVIKRYSDSAYDREIKIFASMWSPPIWMKTNNHFNQGSLKGSIGSGSRRTENEKYFSALAEIKKNFILNYKAYNISLWGLTVMNEPYFAVQPFLNFNTMIFPQKDYENYIVKYLGPALREDLKLKDFVLMVHDDNRRYLTNFTEPTLRNPAVMRYVNGVAVHGYVDEDYALMDDIYDKFKPTFKTKHGDLIVLATELCSGHLPFMDKALIGNWHRGVHYALDIIRNLQHSAAGWVDWNMALDMTGGPGWLGGRLDSAIIVDKANDGYYKSPMYYVLGQFSRFVPAGSIKLNSRIRNDRYDHHFETVSFLTPGGAVTLIVLNNNPYDIDLNVRITKKNGEAEGEYMRLTCHADSVTTFMLPKKINPTK